MDHLMSPAPKIKMSEYRVPLHIQEQIMKRLPVKSLLQFRSVSKAWKSLIDSPEFITAHTLFNHTPPQHMIVSYEDERGEINYSSYIDDDTFPQQRYRPTLPISVKQLNNPRVVGTSHGLLCLSGSDPNYTTESAVIWNPSTRKSTIVAMPDHDHDHSYFGFGVCPVTLDPKIVSMSHSSWVHPEIETKVMVYTLSSGKWRSLPNLPNKTRRIICPKAVTNGSIIYWRAAIHTHNMIMSFDVTNESCEGIDLPDSLARLDHANLFIFKLRESLAVVEYSENISTVWTMEDGAKKSFTKLFNVMTLHEFIVGFGKNGLPIMQLTDGDLDDVGDDDDLEDFDDEATKLVAYEPNSQNNTVLEISESYSTFFVNSYMETLLLLGRSDCNSY